MYVDLRKAERERRKTSVDTCLNVRKAYVSWSGLYFAVVIGFIKNIRKLKEKKNRTSRAFSVLHFNIK